MKTGKNFVRFALALALVISIVAVMSVGAFADTTVPTPTNTTGLNEPKIAPDGSGVTSYIHILTATGGAVTAQESAFTNDTVGLYIAPDAGYQLSSLKVTDATGAELQTTLFEENVYIFTMPSANVTVSATFEQVAAYLDPTIATKTVDQAYSLALDGGSYTDVTKVKVEWTTTDISATRTDNKTWNPGTLTWDATTDTNTVTAGDGTAAFTLTNLSSTQVSAAVTFAQGSTFTAPTVAFTVDGTAGDTGAATIGTVVNSDKTVTGTNDHDTVIGVTVTPAGDDFKALSAASDTQYGTYTVTIGAVS